MSTSGKDQAYPGRDPSDWLRPVIGLTKRELFAMHIMAASVGSDPGAKVPLSQHAEYSVDAAEALIKELNE